MLVLLTAALLAPTGARAASDSSNDGDAPQVKLVDPGAEPRTALRVTAPVGSTTNSTMTMSIETSQRIGGHAMGSPVSGNASTGMQSTVTSIDADGNRRVEVHYSSPTVPDLAGVRMTATMTPVGAFEDVSFEVPSTASAATQSLVSQLEGQASNLSVPYPEAPVGVGAHWVVTQHPKLNGIKVTQRIDYRLTERRGDQLVFDVSTQQTAPRARVRLPGIPSGAQVRITRWLVKGRGTSAVDPAHVMPLDSNLSTKGVQLFALQQGADHEVMRLTISMDMHVTSS